MLYWGLPQTSDRKEAETNYDGHLGNNDTLRTFAPKNFPRTDFFKTLTDGRK